jgi:hypothetical protein
MSALSDLGLGRHIGTTPYQPGTVVDGTLPPPKYVDVSPRSGRLFQEEYTYHSPEDGSWQRWRTPGYHWDARENREYYGVGTYFTVTVRADGLVELDGGGIDGPYPADATGWRATTAALNNFAPTDTSTSGTAEKNHPEAASGAEAAQDLGTIRRKVQTRRPVARRRPLSVVVKRVSRPGRAGSASTRHRPPRSDATAIGDGVRRLRVR